MKPINRMFADKSIATIEEKYKVKYIIDSCLKTSSGQWTNFPVAFFYSEEKHPVGSNYMAVYSNPDNPGELGITDGIRVSEGEFSGFLFDDGTLVHSRYRHDYFDHRGAVVDGGRDYFRSVGVAPNGARRINFKIVDGKIEEIINVTSGI